MIHKFLISLLLLCFVANAHAELVLDHADSLVNGRQYERTSTADTGGLSTCYGREVYDSTQPASVRAAIASALSAAQVRIDRKLLLRVYLTEFQCGLEGRAGAYAAPLLLYTNRKTEMTSSAVAYAEIIDPVSKTLLKSFVVRSDGRSGVSEHQIYLLAISKKAYEVSTSILISKLMHSVVEAAANHLKQLE